MKKVMITLTFVLQFVETCLGIVGEIFVSLYSIQDKALNYMMTIISLIAIYAAVNESSAKTMNTLLLGCGVIIFLCIIIADLYSFLFFSQGVVEKHYTRFVDRYEEKRNCICDLFSSNKFENNK